MSGDRDAKRDANRVADRCADLIAMLDAGEALPWPLGIPTPQMPWLPWYPTDFYGNPMVEAMSDRQQNWYRRLLDKSWQFEIPCFLPNDPNQLAGLCRCMPLDFQADAATVLARFRRTENGAYIYHPRLVREYLDRLPGYLGKRWAAEETNRKRKAERDANRDGMRDGMRNADRDGTAPTSTSTSTSTIKTSPDKGGAGLDSFQVATILIGELMVPGSPFLLRAVEAAVKIESQRLEKTTQEVGRTLAGKAKLFLSLANPKCSIVKFFEDGIYNFDPKTWEKGYVEPREVAPRAPVAAVRTANNLSAASRAIQRELQAAETGGDHGRGNAVGGTD